MPHLVLPFRSRHVSIAVDQKTLADAAQPLFASLNDQQKRRLTEELVRMGDERNVD